MAAPIPLEAPVTMATLPTNLPELLLMPFFINVAPENGPCSGGRDCFQFDVSITIKLFDAYLTIRLLSQRTTAFHEWNAALRFGTGKEGLNIRQMRQIGIQHGALHGEVHELALAGDLDQAGGF